MGLNKINKPEPLAKTALKALRSSILNNELISGVIYNERSLAADLGISRTPVREALVELASKKLVKFLPQKGVVVNTFSKKEIEDAFELRTALEIFSIKKLCDGAHPPDTTLLEAYLADQKKMARANDHAAFMDADRQFHVGFTRLTRNDYLIDMMEDIRDIMHVMGRKALNIQGRVDDVLKEHEAILNAVKKSNPVKAMQLVELHLEKSKNAVYQSMEDGLSGQYVSID